MLRAQRPDRAGGRDSAHHWASRGGSHVLSTRQIDVRRSVGSHPGRRHTLRDTAASMNFAPWRYPSNTASAPFTASALSVTVFSSEAAWTEMFSAKNLASVT